MFLQTMPVIAMISIVVAAILYYRKTVVLPRQAADRAASRFRRAELFANYKLNATKQYNGVEPTALDRKLAAVSQWAEDCTSSNSQDDNAPQTTVGKIVAWIDDHC